MANERYKRLYIDRDRILEIIKCYLEDNFEKFNSPTCFRSCGGTRNRIDIVCDENNFYLDFHFNKDETTTIDITGGNHIDKKMQLAEYIRLSDICSLTNDDQFKNSWFIIENIEVSFVEEVLEILRDYDDSGALVSFDLSKSPHGSKWNLKGKYGERVVMHYYDNQKKVMIQGKPRVLFAMITNGMTELMDSDAITHKFNDYFKIGIKKENIEAQVTHYLPKVNSSLPEKLRKTFLQAIYNLNIDAEMFDYTYLVFPVYRGLEGHLRYIFKNHGIIADKHIGKEFIYDESLCVHILHSKHHSYFSADEISHINGAYNKLQTIRNALFHWNVPIGSLDSTVLYDDIETAKTKIIETLEIVNSYFSLS